MQSGAAEGRVAEILAPFADTLPPEALEGYALPVGDGSARNRRNLRTAMKLLDQAGWSVVDGVMQNANGKPLAFEVLLRQGAQENQAIMDIYANAMDRLGIGMTISTVDDAQYNERINRFDFDMTDFRRALSLSPGNEQTLYWGSKAASQDGSRNLMGMASPAADAMIDTLLTAESHEDFVAAARALDRVLTTGRHVIPIWAFSVGRIAHDKELKYPKHIPIYGDGVEWMPLVWWYQEDE
jgi:peptide/nickel transport system substrate-binding protein